MKCHTPVLLFLLLVAYTPAQTQGTDQAAATQHRNQCRLAVQVLESGRPHTKYEWARDHIMVCAEQAPPVLVRQWRTIGGDTMDVRYLMSASGRIRDRRIYEQMHAVVLDRSRPDVVRVGAMVVLMRYVNSANAQSIAMLAPPPEPIRTIRMANASMTHGYQTRGPVSLQEPVARPVLALFQQIASQEHTESRSVWYAAAVLAKTLGSDVESGREP